ncbi:MAG: NADH-quinone oxidoreductase subunit M [Planctomycetes bacterium]|nr:NADH-quinone oxidoreductase subunit M [Planctomycetota bacterium]
MIPHLLSWMTFVPIGGALVLLLLPRGHDDVSRRVSNEAVKIVTAVVSAIPLILSYFLYTGFDPARSGMQFMEVAPWIPSFNIYYRMGVDGISTPLILMTTIVSFVAVFASWGINKGVKGYFCMFLLLEGAMIGTFCALDMFLFYVFWELMLFPMYFLIGIWGGPRKEYAAIKFFLYTLAGSVLLLLGMLAFYYYSGNTPAERTFDILRLQRLAADPEGPFHADPAFWMMVFVGIFLAFAVKVPIVPLHTWLPDAHVEAPTAISVILAAILLKMGIYGMLRINFPILPDQFQDFRFWLGLIGCVSIVYGAFCAMAQSDLKKLVAYSSVSHMGYCLLGIAALNAAGVNGAVFQLLAHGMGSAMLFLLVGVVYDRAHHRQIDGFGGLATRMPIYAGYTSLAFFTSLGLPSLMGFVGEALSFIGAFQTEGELGSPMRYFAVFSAVAIVITAAYFLWTFQRVFMGTLNSKYEGISDMTAREVFTLAPLGVCVLLFGVYPTPLLDMMNVSLQQFMRMVQGAGQ